MSKEVNLVPVYGFDEAGNYVVVKYINKSEYYECEYCYSYVKYGQVSHNCPELEIQVTNVNQDSKL